MSAAPDFLMEVDIFSDLTAEDAQAIAPLFKRRRFREGQIVIHHGEPGDCVFVIESGGVAVVVPTADGGETVLAEFPVGSTFGEMAVFENEPRSATCRTTLPTQLLVLKRDAFFRVERELPETAIKILYRVLTNSTSRLQRTSEFLSDMVRFGEAARKRAITDDMTGLFNRRFLDDALPERISRARINREPVSLVMLDLDHFNSINDVFGQQIGDMVIKTVVPIFQSVFRDSDILSRYGGDEFTFILPCTEPEEAYTYCRAVCEAVYDLEILKPYNAEISHVTTSQGIAGFPAHSDDVAGLRDAADKALYAAKEAGRNRVVMAGDPIKTS
ncbi:MAG: GGDEF domain-containing protein [Spirochaetaceae bacterium]|nr:MAG: GGDEF domain-containing protein [Spirochaetaceae bacterium]